MYIIKAVLMLTYLHSEMHKEHFKRYKLQTCAVGENTDCVNPIDGHRRAL